MNKQRLNLLSVIVFAAAASRLLPHPDNFTPVAALALFCGAKFERESLAIAIPFAALLLSDMVLGAYPGMLINYLAFAAVACLGFAINGRENIGNVVISSLLGACVFFVISNFSSFIGNPLYPQTAAGLQSCLIAGIPFFKNTLLSDIVYSALFFGGFALAERKIPSLRAPAAA